jgi:hypothetical protein
MLGYFVFKFIFDGSDVAVCIEIVMTIIIYLVYVRNDLWAMISVKYAQHL